MFPPNRRSVLFNPSPLAGSPSFADSDSDASEAPHVGVAQHRQDHRIGTRGDAAPAVGDDGTVLVLPHRIQSAAQFVGRQEHIGRWIEQVSGRLHSRCRRCGRACRSGRPLCQYAAPAAGHSACRRRRHQPPPSPHALPTIRLRTSRTTKSPRRAVLSGAGFDGAVEFRSSTFASHHSIPSVFIVPEFAQQPPDPRRPPGVGCAVGLPPGSHC